MSGFLSGLFERKSASEQQAVSHAVSASPSARGGMFSSGGQWDTDRAVKDGYEKVLWVFRCVDAIASNQSAIPILHRKGDPRTGTLMQSPDLMRLLNVRTNIYESAAMFRYRLTSQLLLSRRGAFIEIVGDPQNPESLHLLPPTMCEPIPDPLKFVAGYRVRGADMSETILKPEQVIWVRVKPHPIDPYAQVTPLITAGISAETDFLARMFNRNFLQNDGRPGLLVSVRGQMNPEDAQEIKRRFQGGPAQAGQTTVIESDGIDVADMGATPRDAQWQEATRVSKEDILLAFGVPESILGNASGRTFDNADAEYEIFWTHTMKPHCDAIASALDVFTGDQTDDEVIAFDYNSVDVLQRQERRRQESIINRWSLGVITWNEMREELGLEAWKDALAARIIVLPSGFAMAKEGADQAAIMKLPNINAQPDPGKALSEVARQGALKGSREGQRNFENIISARALQLAGKIAVRQDDQQSSLESKEDDIVDAEIVLDHPYMDTRIQLEASLDGLLVGMSSRQESVCIDRLDHAKVRKGTRHWEGETKAVRTLDPLYVVEVDRWARETRDDFERILKPIMVREANRVAKDMEKNGVTATLHGQGRGNPQASTALGRVIGGGKRDMERLIDTPLQQVLDVVEQSTRNQSKRIADRIKALDDEGKSLDYIKRDIKKMVGTRSSWRKSLSGHVTTSAIEGVKHEVYSQAGTKITKTWNTEGDERVRESHVFVDGDTKQADQPFEVGQTMMMYPGDPLAPVEEVANCRCWLSWNLNT